VFGRYLVFIGQQPHANFRGKRGCDHGNHCLSLALEIEHRAGHWRGSDLEHELRAICKNARRASGMSFFEGTDAWTLAVIVGLAGVTVLTRSFFFISSEEWSLPDWAQRGLQYAPIAAMAAVVLPEVLMQQGQFLQTWMDARWMGAAVGAAVYFWRRDVLLTIVAGMLAYLPLHLVLGW
jgi:branched-subunit amino acid transport protein